MAKKIFVGAIELVVFVLTANAMLEWFLYMIRMLNPAAIYSVGLPVFLLGIVSLMEFGKFLDEIAEAVTGGKKVKTE